MKYLFVLVLVGLSFVACKHINPFPLDTTLEFVSLEKLNNGTGIDSLAVLKLHFTDGDGNIGLNENDYPFPNDTSIYKNNFFVMYYAKRNGEFVPFLEYNFYARLSRFLPDNNTEPIEGDIEYKIPIRNPLITASATDTVMFECWLLDRDLKESNHVFTKEIIVVNRL